MAALSFLLLSLIAATGFSSAQFMPGGEPEDKPVAKDGTDKESYSYYPSSGQTCYSCKHIEGANFLPNEGCTDEHLSYANMTKVACPFGHDACIKIEGTAIAYHNPSLTYKVTERTCGVTTQFNLGCERRFVNEPGIGLYINEAVVCGCNDKDYCNSAGFVRPSAASLAAFGVIVLLKKISLV